MLRKKILVTGGLGFIGSHTVVELIEAGYEPLIIDNLSNAQLFILGRIEQITGFKPILYQIDLCNRREVEIVFDEHPDIALIIHFAACKAVEESVRFPLKYFKNNLVSLITLLELMEEKKIKNLLFSSSATVYGEPDEFPVSENAPFKKAMSAYGSTKQMGEEIIEKTVATGRIISIALRYFNPVGAHASALIGELPLGAPGNLMPLMTRVAIGKQKELVIYGNDYATPDGTCIRDYIHVVDLAMAHVKASEYLLEKKEKYLFQAFNIGTGQGVSVLELINVFEKTNAVKIPYLIGERRPGDAEKNYADVSKADTVLNWKTTFTLQDMVQTAWQWELGLNKFKLL